LNQHCSTSRFLKIQSKLLFSFPAMIKRIYLLFWSLLAAVPILAQPKARLAPTAP
jgi:hypothetical protein